MSKESRIMNDFPPVSLISPLRQGTVVRAQIQRRCEQVIAVLLHPINACGEQCVWF